MNRASIYLQISETNRELSSQTIYTAIFTSEKIARKITKNINVSVIGLFDLQRVSFSEKPAWKELQMM